MHHATSAPAPGSAAALQASQDKVSELIATRTKQQKIVSECTKQLEVIEEKYRNRAGKKPAQYHTLQAKISKAKQIMLGSYNEAVDMLSEADVASAAVEHASYHCSRAGAPAGRTAASEHLESDGMADEGLKLGVNALRAKQAELGGNCTELAYARGQDSGWRLERH